MWQDNVGIKASHDVLQIDGETWWNWLPNPTDEIAIVFSFLQKHRAAMCGHDADEVDVDWWYKKKPVSLVLIDDRRDVWDNDPGADS